MHMADALLSPAVGGTMWAVSAATIAGCSAKLGRELDDRKVPLMGVLGAFIFAAQMINFSIPGTGSSGHLAGGLLLSILLGPCAAFLTIASVLVVQALFFADGGLLALGCNIINMGFFPAFVIFPFFYRRAIGTDPGNARSHIITVLSAVAGLQLGALAVVLETYFSGISSLPIQTFLLLMQPIHLAIGVVEGIVTVAVVSFVRKARPELVAVSGSVDRTERRSRRMVLVSFLVCAVVTAGGISSFASKSPDGLEWAIGKITGHAELKAPDQAVHRTLANLQQKSAWFPDYSFRKLAGSPVAAQENAGTGVAGLVGTLITLLLAFVTGYLLKKRHRVAARL